MLSLNESLILPLPIRRNTTLLRGLNHLTNGGKLFVNWIIFWHSDLDLWPIYLVSDINRDCLIIKTMLTCYPWLHKQNSQSAARPTCRPAYCTTTCMRAYRQNNLHPDTRHAHLPTSPRHPMMVLHFDLWPIYLLSNLNRDLLLINACPRATLGNIHRTASHQPEPQIDQQIPTEGTQTAPCPLLQDMSGWPVCPITLNIPH